MKKLSSLEQKGIKGGGPCGKQLCGDVIISGATYTGQCNPTPPAGCYSMYLTIINCDSSGTVSHTYCSVWF